MKMLMALTSALRSTINCIAAIDRLLDVEGRSSYLSLYSIGRFVGNGG